MGEDRRVLRLPLNRGSAEEIVGHRPTVVLKKAPPVLLAVSKAAKAHHSRTRSLEDRIGGKNLRSTKIWTNLRAKHSL